MYIYRLEDAKRTKPTKHNYEQVWSLKIHSSTKNLYWADKITIHAASQEELEGMADIICKALNSAIGVQP